MARDIDVEIFEIVLARAFDNDVFVGRNFFGRWSVSGTNRFGIGFATRFFGLFEGFVGGWHKRNDFSRAKKNAFQRMFRSTEGAMF
jgi:hypothetical protein